MRERWFFAEDGRRRGPVALESLVEALLDQPEPQVVLVWRKGLAGWVRAGDVPELARGIERPAAAPVARSAAPPVLDGRTLAYSGGLAALAALAFVGWLSWPARPGPPPSPSGATRAEDLPAVAVPPIAASPPAGPLAPTPARAPAPSAPGPGRPAATPAARAVVEQEAEVPASERRALRGVAGWSADRFVLTVYNPSAWRITELRLKIFRLAGEDFVEDPRPLRLLPPAGQVDPGVVDLMDKVAPDRRKPALNPLDTGPFEGQAGAPPESFRFEIESARGYPPQR